MKKKTQARKRATKPTKKSKYGKFKNGKLVEVTVDMSTWGRGDAGGFLRNSDGQRCCIGFLAEACGISDKKMTNEALLDDVAREGSLAAQICDRSDTKKLKSLVSSLHTPALNVAYAANDRGQLGGLEATDRLRIHYVTKAFKAMGLGVRFVTDMKTQKVVRGDTPAVAKKKQLVAKKK